MAYFAYFAVLGVFVPYIGLFLDNRGLNSEEIGLLLALVGALAAGLTGYYAFEASRALLVNAAKDRLLTSTLVLARRVALAREEIERDLVLVVKLPGERRGPYEEAKLLYEDLTPPAEKKPFSPSEPGVRAPGAGRPTKKERRALDELRGEPDWSAD